MVLFYYMGAIQWCAKPTILKSHSRAINCLKSMPALRIVPHTCRIWHHFKITLLCKFFKTKPATCQTQNFEPRWKRNKRKKELVYPFPAYFLTLRMSGKLRQKGRPLQSANVLLYVWATGCLNCVCDRTAPHIRPEIQTLIYAANHKRTHSPIETNKRGAQSARMHYFCRFLNKGHPRHCCLDALTAPTMHPRLHVTRAGQFFYPAYCVPSGWRVLLFLRLFGLFQGLLSKSHPWGAGSALSGGWLCSALRNHCCAGLITAPGVLCLLWVKPH